MRPSRSNDGGLGDGGREDIPIYADSMVDPVLLAFDKSRALTARHCERTVHAAVR